MDIALFRVSGVKMVCGGYLGVIIEQTAQNQGMDLMRQGAQSVVAPTTYIQRWSHITFRRRKNMKFILSAIITFCSISSFGNPITKEVSSWEGTFKVTPHIPVVIENLPDLELWIYKLNVGSKGTAIGFSINEDMVYQPKPAPKGVQPIYQNHLVVVDGDQAEIIVEYKIQGQGGLKMTEKYTYDGKQVSLVAQSVYGGRHDPVWKKQK